MSSTPFPGTAPKDLKPGEEANLRAATGAPEAIVAPPGGTGGPVAWMRKNLFGSVRDTIITLVLGGVLLWMAVGFLDWGVFGATWVAETAQGCRDNPGGACWAYLFEKAPFMLYGTYPFEERWRPTIVSLLIVAMLVASCDRRLWNWRMAAMWGAGALVSWFLMFGGVFGLPYVETGLWGGLPVTLILSVVALAGAFPLAILLALGRRSNLPLIKALCVGFIELIRGVPLISLLIMASVMLPLFLPEGVTIDKFLRALVGLMLFAAAYLAEVVRGGLQAIPKGQYEAADALGLGYRLKTQLIILPQALRLVIPPLVNTFIGFFKDTSLVYIIGIYDLLTAGESAVKDPAWRGFANETYLFLAVVYFVFCFSMSRYSQYLERDLNKAHRR
ncbi:MAG: amino acid ABC transporter permease [Reyranellaceae bacterium]